MTNRLVFVRSRKIRFADCDPAGIGFYPRLIEHVNNTVEDWYDDALGMSFRDLHLKHNYGAPTRSINVDFMAPAILGDMTVWRLEVVGLGRSSIRLQITVTGPEGGQILLANPTLIWCSFSNGVPESAEIPANIRKKMLCYAIERPENNEAR